MFFDSPTDYGFQRKAWRSKQYAETRHMLEQLEKMFKGKRVLITHSGQQCENASGMCKNVRKVTDSQNHYELELAGGRRHFGFVPETVTESSVEGQAGALATIRRKIELLEQYPEPSTQWTEEERLQTVLRLLEEISPDNAEMAALAERIRLVAIKDESILEANRKAILFGYF